MAEQVRMVADLEMLVLGVDSGGQTGERSEPILHEQAKGHDLGDISYQTISF